ncbi:hypothetical protein ACFV6W_11685, partial [Streptomyces sp. NPDC059802]
AWFRAVGDGAGPPPPPPPGGPPARGGPAPPPVRAKAAEEFLNAALEEGGFWDSRTIITPSIAKQFATLAAGACNPIDDVRGTASYRRHAVGIMARRTLGWTWESYRGNGRSTEGAA